MPADDASPIHLHDLGVVVIGRNEGARLQACLASLPAGVRRVYVDSGSTDASPAAATAAGADVVALDLSRPFSAARARNAGLRRLLGLPEDSPLGPTRPTASLCAVLFLDGDTTLADAFIPAALAAMNAEPRLAAVAGRRRERHPDASLYNRLIDIEWDTPVGPARAVGGDAMYRTSALCEVGGFDDGVIAGEEPELCFRLRAAGWTIRRIDAEMTTHDAALSRFGQWWRRHARAGYAYALGLAMHGNSPERYNLRPTASILAWTLGIILLASVLAAIPITRAFSPLVALIYPLQILRIAIAQRRRVTPFRLALTHAALLVLAKWAQLQGVISYVLRGRRQRLIEYKSAEGAR